ncbi:hypothetical protein F5051DRAFT_447771 [Lentinula edodes]|nr:hypothetical protein F5051DRAFT_447771 [Lentinula edodes]
MFSNLLSSLICDDPGPIQGTSSPHSSQTPSSLLSSLISCDLGPPEAYLPHQHLHPPPGPAQATPSPHSSQEPSWLFQLDQL